MDETEVSLIRSYLDKSAVKLRVARDLLERREWDDAVSRAYYAAFHAAQAALCTEGQQADTHQGILTLFGLLFVKTGKLDRKWARALANLKDDRESGDYDALSWIDEASARRAVEEAEGFVDAVTGYVKGRIGPTPFSDDGT